MSNAYIHKGKQVELKDEERTPCEVWVRVREEMGYYRPTSEFNIGKKQEYKDRKNYSESNAMRNVEQ